MLSADQKTRLQWLERLVSDPDEFRLLQPENQARLRREIEELKTIESEETYSTTYGPG